MHLTDLGRAVLIAREGRRLAAYRDSVGIWTIGIGHTSAAGPPTVTPGLRITAAECDALFARDVARYVRSVAATVPPDLADHAFDALVSLCFNIGPGAFARSSVVRRLAAGDRDGAAAAILLWNRPAELIPRRGAEYDQFRTPYALAPPRARRGDAAPIIAPGAPLSAVLPALPSARRSIPRAAATLPVRRPEPPAPTGTLARLWTALRTRLRRDA
ncbi:lysozyme [Methylobacterium sp. BTF04]|uniref:lysozyme n=1 Tax=Methylobacterium sp. BTF04 TaxID=2708300 RepID=UPI0013D2D732|nr:lysozyme [Methylobacterium sp. BTF04]NEU14078.1 lysozyme [Methylobacterium sp. BTF04]